MSDVDGTLLDESGAWPAPPRVLRHRLEQVASSRQTSLTLALASSRTLDELLALQRWLGWPGPCIAEDGALIAIDDDRAHRARRALQALDTHHVDYRVCGRRTLLVVQLGADVARIREMLGDWPDMASADLARADVRELHRLGFSTAAHRRRALLSRRASVLLKLPKSHVALRPVGHSASRSLTVDIVRGGRWGTATIRAGKGAAVHWLRQLLNHESPVACQIVGVGDGENDRSLLAAADMRFVIGKSALQDVEGAIVFRTTGTRGWLDMLDMLSSKHVENPT